MGLFDLFFRDRLQSNNPQVATSATLDELDNLTSHMSAWALREHNTDGTHNVRPSGFDFIPIGGLVMWPSNTPPTSWLVCDGSQISRTTYAALFNVIGTTYGAGDGSTTFNLPDLRQRFPLGKAAAGTGSTIGSTGGAIDHTHTVTGSTDAQGSHTHGGSTGSESSHTHAVSGTSDGPTGSLILPTNPADPTPITLVSNAHTHTFSTTSGAGSAHSHSISSDGSHSHSVSGTSGTNNPPFISVNFIILSGV